MTILITGIAGFIGSHLARNLLSRGDKILGIDNISDYYDVNLKYDRLNNLKKHKNLIFEKIDISNYSDLEQIVKKHKISKICHLAAQAGVRYSLEAPMEYIKSNIIGHLNILEICRNFKIKNLVYASSSSVYGGNKKVPFSIGDRVDTPVSLYAATKRSDELMSYTYNHLYGINTIGLRFFTVYGPWGRPDMATWIFTKKIINEEPIEVFNNGNMERDFTYIDDIINGTVSILDSCKQNSNDSFSKVYNIGNNKPENLLNFISIIEKSLGKKAIKVMKPMQKGDVANTYADINEIKADYNFIPKTKLIEGIPKFIEWFKNYHN
ncbi:MAG: UDP-N-acetylglucosamine 4-epimerase [Alphaproteobacteria bacterium MarineAlpha9_Bin3]|nr:MAG: UDP-N-acetylglucosamine 4-epimerase [Alphaproteobacteria bacterium MarineAlpha9_Bin3]|tara:strand:+ start:10093 stop:11061 length:969 start_codon:yes stop_codon:yes gene_type:complete